MTAPDVNGSTTAPEGAATEPDVTTTALNRKPIAPDPWDHPWRGTTGARSIDLRYLDRDPHTTERPYFEPALRLATGTTRPEARLRLLDVGCANGAFARHVLTHRPHWDVSGIDVLPELVDAASAAVRPARFSIASICEPRSLPAERFDIVTALTLPSHFDTLDAWLPHLLDLLAPGGRAVVYGPVNPAPVDLICRLRPACGDTEWLPGWNVLSQATYDRFLTGRARSWEFHQLPVADLGYPAGAPSDDLSSTVVPGPDGPRLGNASGLTYHMAFLEIRV